MKRNKKAIDADLGEEVILMSTGGNQSPVYGNKIEQYESNKSKSPTMLNSRKNLGLNFF